ncbi:MAG: vanadium-dependent haloperoxidase [Flavobacteriales bacterium]|nr:vanadium-dependent haloperoxidase [Flavobacteriales bacterium]
MKRIIIACGLLAACAGKQEPMPEPIGAKNMAYRWGTIALVAMADDTDRNRPRPPIGARMLALPMIAQFDAWSCYDAVAEPVYLEAARRPEDERTLANKEKAISYAMARVLQVIFPHDSSLFADSLRTMGYDPTDRSLDLTTPQGIGNLAAKTVLDARRNDGSNQFGDDPRAPKPYGDYTMYRPVNTADTMRNIDRWQPKYFVREEDSSLWAPGCLAPYWGHVKPFALDSASQFRPSPPPVMGDTLLARELRQVIDVQAGLTNEQKALVEFMRDGPRSVQQAGHWLIFARDVSLRDQHTLDRDVQMYFILTTTAMDCFIACWDAKMFYDNARPYQQIHHLFGDSIITGWAGPHKGMVQMKGTQWRPYSPDSFLCPPFPAYPSGHSTVSGGCAKALELFTGSDRYGVEVRLLPGWLTEPGITQDSITLSFPTFSNTAEQAGWSRVLGGYHIQTDNVEGLALGRRVAEVDFAKCMAHIKGTVSAMH